MEPDKNTNSAPEEKPKEDDQQAPADALSRTPEDLEQEQAAKEAAGGAKSDEPAEKKVSPIKQLWRKVNVYLLLFVLMCVVAGIITIVSYLNSQKAPATPTIASQNLTQDALKQLANTDTSVGSNSQTLTIQGNAIIAGQTLMRGNLSVATNIQAGGSITATGLTISGKSNLADTQINSLQVAKDTAIQGTTTMRDLNVSGAAAFSGAITASQITVSRLILSGNGVLQLPNHLSFSGTTPGRSFIGSGILGSGSSVSINGSDTSGSINLSLGTGPSGHGCIVKITFRKPFAKTPRVVVSPVGSTASTLQYYVTRDTQGFSLCTNNTPSLGWDGVRSLSFDYFVAG